MWEFFIKCGQNFENVGNVGNVGPLGTLNTGQWYLWHVPSTFAIVNTHANVFFVFLPGGISKEWHHIVSANCDFDREPLPMSL